MARLRAAMTSRYKERDEDVKFHTPRNLETLNLSFRGERVAKVRSSHQGKHRLLTSTYSTRRQLVPSQTNPPKLGTFSPVCSSPRITPTPFLLLETCAISLG